MQHFSWSSLRRTVLLLGVLAAFTPVAHAEIVAKVTQAYVPSPPPKARTAAGYLTLINGGDTPLRLTGARAEFAQSTQIHDMIVVDSIMKMRPASLPLVIEAGKSLELAPGGRHLMFVGLPAGLVAGSRYQLVLEFDSGELEVTLPVVPFGEGAPHEDAG